MSDATRDELQTRLAAAFRREALPAASLALESALERVPDVPVERSRGGRGRSALALLGIAAVLGAGLIALVGGGRNQALPVPSSRPSSPAATTLLMGIRWTPEVPASDGVRNKLIRVINSRLEGTDAEGAPVRVDGPDRLAIEAPAGVDLDFISGRLCLDGHIAFVPLGTETRSFDDPLDPAQFPPLFDGTAVVPGSIAFDTRDALNRPTMTFRLTDAATPAFAAYTEAHVGEEFALAMDGRVVTAPVIQQSIPNGEVQIAMGPEVDNMSILYDVAAVIRSGPLPVDLVDLRRPEPSLAPSPSSASGPTPSPETVCAEPLNLPDELSCGSGTWPLCFARDGAMVVIDASVPRG